jgi:hypothetical protein
MPDNMIGGDLGHELIPFVETLPPIEAERERDGVGEIAKVGGFESSMALEDTRELEHSKNEMDAVVIAPLRMSPTWLLVLPAFLLGMAVEHQSSAVEAPCPAGSAAEIHFGPGEDLERIDVALIREAKARSIWRLTC